MLLVVQPWSPWSPWSASPLGQCRQCHLPASTSSQPRPILAVVLSGTLAADRKLSRSPWRRAPKRVPKTVPKAAWRSGSSRQPTVEAAVEEALKEWQNTEPEMNRISKAQGLKSSERGKDGSDHENLAFGLLFLPCKWASEMKNILTDLRALDRFPVKAPLLGIPTQSEILSFGSASLKSDKLPQAVILEEASLELISRESIRIQDTIDANPMRSIQVYGGKVNGSILAGRNFFNRESIDVGSVLIFGDAASAGVTRRVMGLLDVCYPLAQKAGLLTDENIGLQGHDLTRGCVVLLLPGALGTAVNFCGVQPVGPELQVFDADLRGGVLRRVQDFSAHVVPGERCPSLAAAEALGSIAKDAGVPKEEIWLGLPRGTGRDTAQMRVAPGAGEWALYPWGLISAEGSVVLRANPREEGLFHKSLDRVQLFKTVPDDQVLERLRKAYDLDSLAKENLEVPYAQLCLAAGPGPAKCLETKSSSAFMAVGEAVIGSAGISLPFEKEVRRMSTSMHRQAVSLVMLYSSPRVLPTDLGALDTGAD